jgi:hypothetical protein
MEQSLHRMLEVKFFIALRSTIPACSNLPIERVETAMKAANCRALSSYEPASACPSPTSHSEQPSSNKVGREVGGTERGLIVRNFPAKLAIENLEVKRAHSRPAPALHQTNERGTTQTREHVYRRNYGLGDMETTASEEMLERKGALPGPASDLIRATRSFVTSTWRG